VRIGNKFGKNTDCDLDIVQNAFFAWLAKTEVNNKIKYIALDQYQNNIKRMEFCRRKEQNEGLEGQYQRAQSNLSIWRAQPILTYKLKVGENVKIKQ
jgi:hypothetical protein